MLAMVHQVPKDQLSLAPGIASVDDGVDILFLKKSDEQLVFSEASFDRFKLECFGDMGEMGHAPWQFLSIVLRRHS